MHTKPDMAQLKSSFGEYVENAHRIFKRALSEKQSSKIVWIRYSEGQRLKDLVILSKKHPSYQKFYDTALDVITPNSFNFPVHPHSWMETAESAARRRLFILQADRPELVRGAVVVFSGVEYAANDDGYIDFGTAVPAIDQGSEFVVKSRCE